MCFLLLSLFQGLFRNSLGRHVFFLFYGLFQGCFGRAWEDMCSFFSTVCFKVVSEESGKTCVLSFLRSVSRLFRKSLGRHVFFLLLSLFQGCFGRVWEDMCSFFSTVCFKVVSEEPRKTCVLCFTRSVSGLFRKSLGRHVFFLFYGLFQGCFRKSLGRHVFFLFLRSVSGLFRKSLGRHVFFLFYGLFQGCFGRVWEDMCSFFSTVCFNVCLGRAREGMCSVFFFFRCLSR